MLTTTQIILRLILSLIFGLIIFWFCKKREKILEPKIYLLFSLISTFLSIFSLKIFFGFYSKIDLTILPAALTLGIFIIGRAFIRKEETKEAINSFFYLWFVSLNGLAIGFGFYQLSIFVVLLLLIIVFSNNFSSLVNSFIKKIWKKQKNQSGKN